MPLERTPLYFWKTLTIGGIPPQELLRQLKALNRGVADWTEQLLLHPGFRTRPTRRTVKLACCSVSDLGLLQRPRLADIMASGDTRGLDHCPAEVGPHLLLQPSPGIPLGRWLTLAMKPLIDATDMPCLLTVAYTNERDQAFWLHSCAVLPHTQWHAHQELIFQIRD